jgi:sugar diacid utilization regulator
VLTDVPLPPDAEIAVVCADVTTPESLSELAQRLTGRRVLLLTAPVPVPTHDLRRVLHGHVVVEVGGTVDPAAVVLSIARTVELPDETITRRLVSLQRSFTQVLGEPEPVVALLGRLRTTCNATAAIVDKRGQAVHSTGPVPLALLFSEITQTSAETQMLSVDGWFGVADRIHDSSQGDQHLGWLVAVARRPDFPDSYTVSAVHVAASLVEASQRMTLVARQQERAIRAAVLEEALALQRVPDDPELTGRIASFGVSFGSELRTAVVRPLRSSPSSGGRNSVRDAVDLLSTALANAGIASLVSVRNRYAVLVVQASPSTLRRLLVAAEESAREVLVGVGRRVHQVSDVAASYHDAQLAIQSLQRYNRGPRFMSYEDFDFATRLFSEVGLDRMTGWATEFLQPLEQRKPLMEGLSSYFAHSQNMNAAADALSIHHNSLRYRLAKVEELLDVSLRDPAAVSSLFLALAARELRSVRAAVRPRSQTDVAAPPQAAVEAPRDFRDWVAPSVENLGVVIHPDL